MSGWAIDLGTTNTGVARWDEVTCSPQLVALPDICRKPGAGDELEAPKLVPSATHMLADPDLATRVGAWPFFAGRTFWGKRAWIGRQALDLNVVRPLPCFAPTFKPYLSSGATQTIARTGKRTWSARAVAGVFVRELMAEIKCATGVRPREIVVTTPVDCYEAYRAEVVRLFKRVGVRRVRFLDEPVAAAIGYGLGLKRQRHVLVVDMGGGTLDLALVSLSAREMASGSCEVLAKEGRAVGGDLVDRWLLAEICRRLDMPSSMVQEHGPNMFWARQMIDEACRVKEVLYFRKSEAFGFVNPDGTQRREAQDLLEITQQDLRDVLVSNGLVPTLQACIEGIRGQAAKRGLTFQDIDQVLMVGGSTLLPFVYPTFQDAFGRDKVRAWQPFEAVVYGAAAFAAGEVTQSDFIVHDYAFVTYDAKSHEPIHTIVVPKGTRFPTEKATWKKRLVPTCSLGEPEKVFKMVICELGIDEGGDRRFAWDAEGKLHKFGGASGGTGERIVVPLNEADPVLGRLDPPHNPSDRTPRLEIAFGVNADRWLIATVRDLQTDKVLMQDEAVVRLL
jgi:molecular chaperone DnaK (HSP70)